MHSFISDNAIFLQLQYKVVCNYVSKNIKNFSLKLVQVILFHFLQETIKSLKLNLKNPNLSQAFCQSSPLAEILGLSFQNTQH